ncbi:MAG: TetR/AcrR family transcriptional regulator [Spirochaetales bacterium]|nr:TetR/AcrR family transcriptional regulator [Spirochaetales bacterium]
MNRKETIIETTRKLLWERGYAATSPKAIQKESGVGQGSMYHHFAGKKELALAAIEENMALMKEGIEMLFSEEISPLDRIRKYLLREREVLKGCPVGRLIYDPDIYSDQELSEPLEKMFQWIIDKISITIEEGIEENELMNVNAKELSSMITATLQGSYIIARSEKSIEPFEQSINGLLNLLNRLKEKENKDEG